MQFLNEAALTLWGAPITWAEVFGDVTGALCVWLVARQHILNWPLGLINNTFWSMLFWNAKLYADSVLQGFFFVLGVFGWWTWTFGGEGTRNSLPVRRTSSTEWIWIGGITAAATVALAAFLDRQTDSPAPLWDSSVLTLSLAATYGQAKKLLECWWLWIAVDVISVPLYISRQLYPTAALYVVFGIMCVYGLIGWRRDLAGQHSRPLVSQ